MRCWRIWNLWSSSDNLVADPVRRPVPSGSSCHSGSSTHQRVLSCGLGAVAFIHKEVAFTFNVSTSTTKDHNLLVARNCLLYPQLVVFDRIGGYSISLVVTKFGLSSRYRWVHADFHVFSCIFTGERMILGWVHGLGQIVVFDQADCVFIYDDFQQCSGLFHTSFQELSGDIGSCLAPQIGRFVEFSAWHWHWTILLYLTRKIACFIYHDFQQFSGLSHTPFQELSGDVGSCLAPQIGRFDVENLDSKNPEIYHDFLQFSGKNPGSYHVFRTFPGANPVLPCFSALFRQEFSNLPCFSDFSGENPRIFHEFQKSLGCLRLQVRRIKFSLYDRVAR